MPLPDHYAPSEILDADGRRRTVIFAYDAEGRPVASFLFKGRNEIPEYSLLRTGAAQHLGQIPCTPRRPDGTEDPGPKVAYLEWLPFDGGTGSPHYVVDVTPVGVAELAARLSGDAQWQSLANEMRAGTWSPRALRLADALAAMMSVNLEGLPTIDAADAERNAFADMVVQRAAAAIDAVLAGEVTPELAAFEPHGPDIMQFFVNQVELGVPNRTDVPAETIAYWRDRTRTLGAEGNFDVLLDEMDRAAGGPMRLPYELQQRFEQVLKESVLCRFSREVGDVSVGIRAWFPQEHRPDAVLTVARALAGDPGAGRDVQQALRVMARHDQFLASEHERQVRLIHLMPPDRNAPKPLESSSLVLVHVTRYEPTRGADGSVELSTRFDTEGFGRATLHFTLNHTVVSHMYGNWDDAKFVVVAPFGAAVKRNGDPANLLGVDTWWVRDPGVPVRLPDAVIVQVDPGQPELLIREGDEVRVKSRNFTTDEIATLEAEGLLDMGHVEQSLEILLEKKNLTEETVPAAREAFIATAARNYAVNETIRSLGGPVTRGGGWECAMEDRIRPIALARGLDSSAHDDTPFSMAEKYGDLSRAAPETRRVTVAAGNIAPGAERVVTRSQDRDATALLI